MSFGVKFLKEQLMPSPQRPSVDAPGSVIF